MAVKISEYINNIVDPTTRNAMQQLWEAVDGEIDDIRTLVNELRAWAIAIATKLNADTGVTDTDYDTTISAGEVEDSITQ